MRRIALIVLIAVLPLQSIWVAAANACQAECSSSDMDFGHHEHEHAGVVATAHDASGDASGDHGANCGADCSSFHGHGNAAVIHGSSTPVPPSRHGIVPSPYERFMADRFLDSPLRPPRQPLA